MIRDAPGRPAEGPIAARYQIMPELSLAPLGSLKNWK